jgi:hypothetical protein
MRDIWDRIGISASILCVVHCLVTPFAVVLLPFVANFFEKDTFHIIIVFIVVPVAAWALWNGYLLHKFKRVLVLGGLGVSLLLVGMLATKHGSVQSMLVMVAAGLSLASAHLFNLRACRKHI